VVGTNAGETPRVRCRFGLHDASMLDRLADSVTEDPAPTYPIHFDRGLLERWDPKTLAIPELVDRRDLAILASVSARIPVLGSESGWNIRCGRELHATDDRSQFVARHGEARHLLPIVEGKHLEPFRVSLDSAEQAIPIAHARRLIDPGVSYERARLAYRDVSGRTNRLTLIAALLPAGTISTHTVFCVKSPLDEASTLTLLALLNSLVANYLARLRVTTHVTTAVMSSLGVPRPTPGSRTAVRLEALARRLQETGVDGDIEAYAELNACVAGLYGLAIEDYEHIVGTFPLLPETTRSRCVRHYVQAAEAQRHREDISS
jgi:hypothetical protein